ncbi:cellulose biosynthesis protein BcsC [Pollutimonas subterranea]|uniref:Cellulose biosynthesis protein BcsC n=1 Tax=Pollutimonas subterranea TaxID=2045210 RepID=A0A2N4U018_9BURK|nr:cellulose synthase complex outer membrane protein BcsC [Pollutimonas subterranea]PLC48376.1 cellulose biosynthesis protein BcsC [Pollutimonas subterranea]
MESMPVMHIFIGVLFLLLSTGAPGTAYATVKTQGQAQARLLEQINMGESLYRDDIILDAVEKLYRVAPQHLEGLAAELRLAVRRDQLDKAASLLKKIDGLAPGSQVHQNSLNLMALSTSEGAQTLAMARLYAAAGRVGEAIKLYDGMFKGEYPTVDYALEYWQVRAREPDGRPIAIVRLTELLASYPRHAGLLAAVSGFNFAENNPQKALEHLHTLAKQPAHRDFAASQEYEYLSTLRPGPASVAAWISFTERYGDLVVGSRARQTLAGIEKLIADPMWNSGQEGLRLVNQGKNAQALIPLQRAIKAYPDDADLHGALGLAYSRTGNRSQALIYFENARAKEVRADQTSKWSSLIKSTRYWLLLQNAADAVEQQHWGEAQSLYRRAHRLDPDDIHAIIGLGDVALATGLKQDAWRFYRRALDRTPRDEAAQRGIARYLASETPDQALSLIDGLSAIQQDALSSIRRSFTLAMLDQRAEQARRGSQWSEVVAALSDAQRLDLNDPWLSYRLAMAFRQAGRPQEGIRAFEKHLLGHVGEPVSQYAYALLLASLDDRAAASESLHKVAAARWTADMAALHIRLQDEERIDQATRLYEMGSKSAAVALLETAPASVASRLQIAAWSLADGHYPKALFNYGAILRDEPENISARLGQLETWLAQGKVEAVRLGLKNRELALLAADSSAPRVAALWKGIGDDERAYSILNDAASQTDGPAPLLFRDLARLTALDDPDRALDHYEKAMADGKMLPPRSERQGRNGAEFTRAMRVTPTDDWLTRSIRSDAASLYQLHNPTLSIASDVWGRRDGTPGLSRLSANTTIAQLDLPMRNGKAFLRADHVRMNAGSFETNPAGENDALFGTCLFSAVDAQAVDQTLPGCGGGLEQKASGTSFAAGWQGERLAFDLGRTPQGFAVTNWTGGVSYKGDLHSLGWTATASRRPMSNSLLSFAGTQDPRTGVTWGGVMATGISLGLSWDKGEENGVWADISHHKLTGRNVADNQRTRVMAGYYRRLINQPRESLTVGVNLMHWRYQRDLGGYTLGQGGYYSPQRYSSVSLPIGYARRLENWSFLLEGSVSASVSQSKAAARYPVPGLINGPLSQLEKLGVTGPSFAAANGVGASSNSGKGYALRAVAERRLDSHWVLGGGIDLQHGEDYAPSRFILYLRYTFKPWQGDLKLRPANVTPYADFK